MRNLFTVLEERRRGKEAQWLSRSSRERRRVHFNLVGNPIKLLCDCGTSRHHVGFRHQRNVTCLAPLSWSRFHPITLKYTTIRTPAARLTVTKCYLNPNNDVHVADILYARGVRADSTNGWLTLRSISRSYRLYGYFYHCSLIRGNGNWKRSNRRVKLDIRSYIERTLIRVGNPVNVVLYCRW